VDPLISLLQGRGEYRRCVVRENTASEEARLRWLIRKVREMKLTRSRLIAEAEERLSCGKDISWSQAVFTDLFGPDVSIMGELGERISRLERNIVLFSREARRLHRRVRR